MSARRWPEVERLCQAALERPAEARAAFLAEACGGDDTLRHEVESLLAQLSRADSFIETPALEMDAQRKPDPGLTVGQRVGMYQVVSWLGAGGMGEVYRAHDTDLRRDVALKVLPSMLVADPERLARFEREARVLASLNHPNVGAIYGVARQDSVRALVLELVEGETLADKLERSRSGALPVNDALGIARQIANALEAAHEKGVIHRDLKPANVKVTPTGMVKVLDFGLAKLATRDGARNAGTPNPSQSPTITAGRTRDGLLLGTARYMSPEQARGHAVDKRTDVWAFGCVLFEMLTGHAAFPGATVTDTLAAIIEREPDWTKLPATLRPNIRKLLRRCLEKEPSRRLHDIADARLEIDEADEWVDVAAVEKRSKPGRFRFLGWATAAVFMLTTAVAAGIAYFSRPTPDTRVYRSTFVPPANLANLPGGRLALSPDGRRLAFTAPRSDGRTVLWVHALDTLTAQPLPGTEDAISPFWSPDSRFVAFAAAPAFLVTDIPERRGKLKKIDASGGPVLTVSDVGSIGPGTWNRGDVVLFNQTLSASASSPIFRVAASGGTSVPVTELDAKSGETHTTFPSFLPDGRHFLYVRVNAAGSATYVGSLDSPDRTRLVDGWTNAKYASGHLLYVRGTTLVAQPFDLKRLALTGDPVPLAEHLVTSYGYGYDTGAFSVSDVGVLVYQASTSDDDESRLVWLDRAGRQTGVLGDRTTYGPRVALSRVSRQAAVVVKDPSAAVPAGRLPKFDLWTFDVGRNLRTPLILDPTIAGTILGQGAMFPIWAPDGSRIVFASNRRGHFDLYQQAASGAGTAELLLGDDLEKAPESWSPDGRFILYLRPIGLRNEDVWVLPLSGERKPFPLIQSPADEYWSQFSPDGRWVAYQSNESGRYEVYVTPFPGRGEKWRVSPAGGTEPRWRHDGREIFFLTDATTPTSSVNAARTLMAAAVRSDGPRFEVGAIQRLFDVRVPAQSKNGVYKDGVYDVSADGRFLVEIGEDQPPITIVVNWPALLRK